jgi:hypothetical protein
MRHSPVRIPRFHARITWDADREAATGTRLVHPVWFPEDGPSGEGWSLVLTLAEPVAWGDKSTKAFAHFLTPTAPHQRLRPGRSFGFRAGTIPIGQVQLGEPAGFIDLDA